MLLHASRRDQCGVFAVAVDFDLLCLRRNPSDCDISPVKVLVMLAVLQEVFESDQASKACGKQYQEDACASVRAGSVWRPGRREQRCRG